MATGPARVDLSWTAATDNVGVQGYQVFRNGVLLSAVGTVGSTSFSDTGLSPSTAYTYTVRAVDAAGLTSAASAAAVATTSAAGDAGPPSAPTGLAAVAVAWNQVDLSWAAATDDVGVTSYVVNRNGTRIALVSGTSSSFTDRSTAASTAYTYTVTATDAAGNTGPAATAGTSTPAVGQVITTFNPVADAYVDGGSGQTKKKFGTATTLLVAAAGDKRSYLRFDTTSLPAGTITGATLRLWANVGDAAGYRVHTSTVTNWSEANITYATAPAFGSVVATTAPVTSGGYTATSVSSVVTTRGLITFVATNNGTSNGTYQSRENTNKPQLQVSIIPAAPADTTAPSVPTGLSAMATGPARVDLSWTAATDNVGVQGYQVFRNGVLLSAVGTVGSTSFSDTGLSPSTAYTYTVRAVDAAGLTSAASAAAVATTSAAGDAGPPSAPTGLAAMAVAWNQVDLSWAAATDDVGVTSYVVNRNGTRIALVSGTSSSFTDRSTAASTAYTYTVTATDAAGNTGPAATAGTSTPAEPPLFLTNPWPSATLFADETVTAVVTDEAGVTAVEFLVGTTVVATDASSPFEAVVDTTTIPDGQHQVTARKITAGGAVAGLPTTVTFGNALSADERLEVDWLAGRISVDDYVRFGIYAHGADVLLPERYQSPTPTPEGTTAVGTYLAHFDEVTQATRDEITAFLDQPLRGDHYAIQIEEGEPQAFTQSDATESIPVPPGITDECQEFSALFGLVGSGLRCVHDTPFVSIRYFVESTGRFERNNIDTSVIVNGTPEYIDRIAEAMDDAYEIYESELGYPTNWDGLVPVLIHGGVEGGQVLPQGVTAGSLNDSVQTIEMEPDSGAPMYLAHHELFHVFQYQFVGLQTVGTALFSHFEFRWWCEASAEWAAGYVTQRGAPGDVTQYTQNLASFFGRPNERINAFDNGTSGRQYGSFVFAEYLVERLTLDANNNFIRNPHVIKSIWQRIKDNPGDPLDRIVSEASARGFDLGIKIAADFAVRNYLLDYDTAIPPRLSDVESAWRAPGALPRGRGDPDPHDDRQPGDELGRSRPHRRRVPARRPTRGLS